jgi:hypothetical protein
VQTRWRVKVSTKRTTEHDALYISFASLASVHTVSLSCPEYAQLHASHRTANNAALHAYRMLRHKLIIFYSCVISLPQDKCLSMAICLRPMGMLPQASCPIKQPLKVVQKTEASSQGNACSSRAVFSSACMNFIHSM